MRETSFQGLGTKTVPLYVKSHALEALTAQPFLKLSLSNLYNLYLLLWKEVFLQDLVP